MLDRYWFGDVERISPEAPVPIVKIARTEERPGGAANVARNAAALGAQTTLLSVTGADEAGATLERLLAADRVADVVSSRPGAAHDRQDARRRAASSNCCASISRPRPRTRCSRPSSPTSTACSPSADLLILSDYGKGGLAHIATMIERARAAGKPVLVDPKGDDWDKISRRDGDHAQSRRVPAGRRALADAAEMTAKAQALRAALGVDSAARHALGGGDEPVHGGRAPTTSRPSRARCTTSRARAIPSSPPLGALLGAGADLPSAVRIANEAAGVVVGKLGTAVATPDELA